MARFASGVLSALLLSSTFLGCGDDDVTPEDAGPGEDAPADAGADAERPGICNPRGILWYSTHVDTVVGITREVRLGLERDLCEDAVITLTSSAPGVVTFPGEVTIPVGSSRIEVPIEGAMVGDTTLTATFVDLPGTPEEQVFEVTLDVTVHENVVPGCSADAVTGRLAPGGEVRSADGLTGIALPEGAARDDEFQVEAFDVEIACAPDQVPDGFLPLGPAVRIGAGHERFVRELPLTIPVNVGLLPENAYRGQVRFVYTGAGVDEPRIVPVASPDFESNIGHVTFFAPRLGTYQAVTLPPVERMREFSYRAIMGVSMGSGGAALIGTHNADRFDFIGPLGGPVDWISLMHYIRTYHLGGFCTEAERIADPEGCAGPARTDRTPPTTQRYEVRQDFEHWYYEDDWNGHGGTFDRREYIRIFRDLAMMYGNPNTTAVVDPMGPNVVPPGIADSERMRPDGERCAEPVVLSNYYDDEYNPEGTHPVITFCDGGEIRVDGERDIGVWSPEGSNSPIEVALAVDLNDNGVRDAGEPVIRAGRENFEDCGLDQLCNPDEAGYDPVTNPDPAGDDYDFQYNPTGTEGNWLRDYTGPAVGDCTSPVASPPAGTGERFEDAGLDGVMGTPQLADGGYDIGEADDCWTLARGLSHMFANNPRGFVLGADEDVLRDVDFFSDGGIRDLFNFATNQDHLAGAFTARGLPLNLYNSHAALRYSGLFEDADFDYSGIDWRETGKFIQMRYGNVDAVEGRVVQGDGQHVGTPTQIINRLLSVLGWMSQRWPGGDRRPVSDRICTEMSAACPQPNQFTFDFTSPTTGRTGPVAVVLPPGYSNEEYADVDYPVVYLLHGYGQEPDDLVAIGIVIWNFMIQRTIPEAERLQKMIFVFPDGRCRNDECVKGTFYADAPAGTPDGAQMETFMLDLMDHIDANYRTRSAESHLVIE